MIYNLDTGIITPGVAFQGFTKPSIYSVVVTLLGFIYAVIQIVAAIVS